MRPSIPLIVVSCFLLFACDETNSDPQIEQEIFLANYWIEVDLQQFKNEITEISGSLSRTGLDTIRIDFEMLDNVVSSKIDGVPVGIWDLNIEAYYNNGLSTYAGSIAVDINLSYTRPLGLILRRIARNDSIIVTWGSNNEGIEFGSAPSISTGETPNSIVLADLDQDEDQDLIITNYLDRNLSILLNDGIGNFTELDKPDAGIHPAYLVIRDFDGEGFLEIAVANYDLAHPGVSILSYNTDSSKYVVSQFIEMPSGVGNMCSGDLDNDGDLDLACANRNSGDVSIMLNNGLGEFSLLATFHVRYKVSSISSGDFDGDDDMDLAIVGSSSNDLLILENKGATNFRWGDTYSLKSNPWESVATDINQDGQIDLLIALRNTNQIAFLRNLGDGSFVKETFRTDEEPIDVAVGDINNDGDRDFAVACFTSGTVSFYCNHKNQDFYLAYKLSLEEGSRAISLGDLNGDGLIDAAVVNQYQNELKILINQTMVP